MTPDEIDKMEAGRELDTLIAEKVMGLGRLNNPDAKIVFIGEYPHYSTDIAAAWEVVEKLKSMRFDVKVAVNNDDFMNECYLDRSDFMDEYCLVVTSSQETPMLAICRAALKAVIASKVTA